MSDQVIMLLTTTLCWVAIHGAGMGIRLVNSEYRFERIMRWLAGCVCIGVIYLLCIVASFLSPYADPWFQSPILNGMWAIGSVSVMVGGTFVLISCAFGQMAFFMMGWWSDDNL
jgi:hypothetical protein